MPVCVPSLRLRSVFWRAAFSLRQLAIGCDASYTQGKWPSLSPSTQTGEPTCSPGGRPFARGKRSCPADPQTRLPGCGKAGDLRTEPAHGDGRAAHDDEGQERANTYQLPDHGEWHETARQG